MMRDDTDLPVKLRTFVLAGVGAVAAALALFGMLLWNQARSEQMRLAEVERARAAEAALPPSIHELIPKIAAVNATTAPVERLREAVRRLAAGEAKVCAPVAVNAQRASWYPSPPTDQLMVQVFASANVRSPIIEYRLRDGDGSVHRIAEARFSELRVREGAALLLHKFYFGVGFDLLDPETLRTPTDKSWLDDTTVKPHQDFARMEVRVYPSDDASGDAPWIAVETLTDAFVASPKTAGR